MLWKDDIVPLSAGDYERATAEFLRVAEETDGVVGVWQTGSVSVPGISDLDFILVIRDGAGVSWKLMRNCLSPETSRVLLHSPIAITENLFPWLGYLSDTRGTRRLAGPDFSFREPENKGLINLMVSARFTMAKLMGLVRTTFIGRVSVRSFLCRVHGIRHNFTLMERLVPPVFHEAEDLRESWFKTGNERLGRLEKLLSGARDACLAFLRDIEIPWPIESGSDELLAGNWRFFGGDGYRERRGALSWLSGKGRLGELAYYSTWFELGITPGLSGLLAGTLAPDKGREDWEKHLEALRHCEETSARLKGFSTVAPSLSLRGWRRWVP